MWCCCISSWIILDEGVLSHEHMLRFQSHLTHFSTTTRYRDIPSLNDIYVSPQALNINGLFISSLITLVSSYRRIKLMWQQHLVPFKINLIWCSEISLNLRRFLPNTNTTYELKMWTQRKKKLISLDMSPFLYLYIVYWFPNLLLFLLLGEISLRMQWNAKCPECPSFLTSSCLYGLRRAPESLWYL